MTFLAKLSLFSSHATKKAVLWASCWTAVMMVCELLSLFEALAWLGYVVTMLQLIGIVLLVVLVVDYVWLLLVYRYMHTLTVSRQLPSNLPVYELSTIELTIHHDNRLPYYVRHCSFQIMDFYPEITQAQGLPAKVSGRLFDVTDGYHIQISYRLYAHQRGFAKFGGVDWLVITPIGLLSKRYHTPKHQILGVNQARILANFKSVLQGGLLANGRHSSVAGMIKRRRKGQGHEFHQIRSYTQGDSIRYIDWKATARHQRLMSKEYQDEADQEIMFLLDCGQHMRHIRFADEAMLPTQHDVEQLGISLRMSHLDMALNAMLLLAEVANQQADATGFISFGADKDKTVPAKKGTGVVGYLLNQSFDLTASMNAPDYMAAARRILSLQKRRSLLIIITNIRAENIEEVTQSLQLLTQKHRVILVNLYESDLQTYLHTAPEAFDEALTYHSVYSYLHTQKQLNVRLAEQTGAMVVGSTPQELPSKLLDSYWMARRWGVV